MEYIFTSFLKEQTRNIFNFPFSNTQGQTHLWVWEQKEAKRNACEYLAGVRKVKISINLEGRLCDFYNAAKPLESIEETRLGLHPATVLVSEEMDKNWLEVWGVTYVSHGCRGQAALSQNEIAHEWVCECGCMFGGQEPQHLLTCIAEDPTFNYWLEHLGDRSDGDALDEKAIKAIIGTKLFLWCVIRHFNFLCVKQIEKVGVGK